MSGERPDDPVQRLPRGKGLKLSGPDLFRIAITASMLVAVIALAKPCANAVSGFVTSFDQSRPLTLPPSRGARRLAGSASSPHRGIPAPAPEPRLFLLLASSN
jgi:hypothetical protein